MVKVTLKFDGTARDFEEAIGMDDNFDLVDSIIYAIDYCERGEKSYHNDIEIKVKED